MSWIIKLGNEFEAKGHLQQGVICCGCHHLGKGLFRGAGEVGGCAVDFSVADCLLLNSTVETPRSHCFLLWGGIGAWGHTGGLRPFWSRREPGTQLECRVSVVMVVLLSALGLHRSGFAPHPVMWELPQGVPEAAGGSSSAVGGQCQVGAAATAQCSELQSRDSSSLLCPPPLSPLAKDFPKLHLVSTSRFSLCLGSRLAHGGFSYGTWQGGW